MECHNKVLEINPKNDLAWHHKGSLLYGLEKYEEAIACFDKALEIDLKNAGAWAFKVATLVELGRYEEAIGCCDTALDIDPMQELARSAREMAEKKLKE